jgi:hypothetical protein
LLCNIPIQRNRFNDETIKRIRQVLIRILIENGYLDDNKEIYYLVIVDEDGTVIQKEEFQIESTFGLDEYDFFD